MNICKLFIVISTGLLCCSQRLLLAEPTNINEARAILDQVSKTEVAKFNAKLENAKNDATDIVSAKNLSDEQKIGRVIEKSEMLQSNDPVYSLDFESQAAVLLETSNPPAVFSIFDNVMGKKSPDDIANSINYFLQKTVFVLRYINTPQIGGDQQRLLKVADFIGEIRSNTITGFQVAHINADDSVQWGFYDRGTNSWSYILNIPTFQFSKSFSATQELSIQALWMIFTNQTKGRWPKSLPEFQAEQRQSLNVTNQQQLYLRQCDRVLVNHLLNNCSRFSPDEPTNADFIKQIISAAHLTEEERNRLLDKNN